MKTVVLCVNGSAAFEQKPDDIDMRAVICPVQTRLTTVVANRRIHTALEQEFGGGSAATSAGVQECGIDLLRIRTCRDTLVEVAAEHIQAPQRGGALHVKMRPEIG